MKPLNKREKQRIKAFNFISKDYYKEKVKLEKEKLVNNEIPDVEPWDRDIETKEINALVLHPVPISNKYLEERNNVQIKNYLTKTEKKKIYRINKNKKNEEIRNKQKLGLIKPPKARLTYNNYLRVLANEALTDPTSAEKKIKQAYKERFMKMIKLNKESMLTKQEKADKFKRKLEIDFKKKPVSILFILLNPSIQQLYKVKINSKQLMLTGFLLKYEIVEESSVNKYIFYLEGGGKSIERIKNLLKNRIKWTINDDSDVNKLNMYSLLWEGNLKGRQFRSLIYKRIKNKDRSLNFLKNKGLFPFFSHADYTFRRILEGKIEQ